MGCFSGSETKTQSASETKTPEQKEWLKKALELYGPELGKKAEIFPESRVAPFSALQQEAITGVGTFADYFSEPKTTGTPLFEETGTAVKGLLAGDIGAKRISPQATEDYFKGAIYDPTMKTFREDTIPGIAESFAGPGFWGGGRSQEQAKAYQDVGEQLGVQRAGLEWDVEMFNRGLDESKAGRTLATLPGAMAYGRIPQEETIRNLQIAASQLGGLGAIFGIGQAQQTQAQAELQDEIVRFAEENAITDPENLAILLSLLQMNYGSAYSKSTGSGPGLGYAGISGLAGGVGMGIGQNLGAQFFAPPV